MEESPVEVTQKYLDGLQWPASKEEVVHAAEGNGAPDDVVEQIRAMDRESFAGINEVHNLMWKDTE